MTFRSLPMEQADHEPVFYTNPHPSITLSRQLDYYLNQLSEQCAIIVLCVGTDRSTGDSLGPLVGMQLSKHVLPGIHVFGTLDEPVHALNLEKTIQNIEQMFNQPFIIGIDACVGQLTSVGAIKVCPGPLRPGAGVNKQLPSVGNIHMTGIVNVGGFMEYFVLQNTRLSVVMNMATTMTKALYISLMQYNRRSQIPTTPFIPRENVTLSNLPYPFSLD